MILSSITGDLRQIRAIEGTTTNDLLTWCCCPLCALVQESQEIVNISQGKLDYTHCRNGTFIRERGTK